MSWTGCRLSTGCTLLSVSYSCVPHHAWFGRQSSLMPLFTVDLRNFRKYQSSYENVNPFVPERKSYVSGFTPECRTPTFHMTDGRESGKTFRRNAFWLIVMKVIDILVHQLEGRETFGKFKFLRYVNFLPLSSAKRRFVNAKSTPHNLLTRPGDIGGDRKSLLTVWGWGRRDTNQLKNQKGKIKNRGVVDLHEGPRREEPG